VHMAPGKAIWGSRYEGPDVSAGAFVNESSQAGTVGSLLAITCPIVVLTPAPASDLSLSNGFICVTPSLSETARAGYVSRLRLMKKDEDAIHI
jgi:hypothetical protein